MFNLFFKIFVLLFSISFIYQADAHSQNYLDKPARHIACSPELKKCVRTLLRVPEIRELIDVVQKEGAIRIMMNNRAYLSQEFGAFWDGDNRIIFVNFDRNRTEADVLGSIIFELHNALANSRIRHFDDLAATGKIDREGYVEGVERIEYENSIKSAIIARKGVEMGILPPQAQLPTYSSFEVHYRMQKIGGHSAWIAKNYDEIAPRRV